MKESKIIYSYQRRKRILEILDKKESISVKELSNYFNISEVTIRNDLNNLAKEGKIIRTHGGAVSLNDTKYEQAYHIRKSKNHNLKVKIGKAAASLVEDSEVIFIDASSTASEMLPYLKQKSELTVITNSIEVCNTLIMYRNIHLIILGGNVRRESLSTVGSQVEDIIKYGNIGKAFFGAKGFDILHGLTDINQDEINLKKSVANKSQKIIALIDYTKWDKVSFGTFAPTDNIDTIITDKKAPKKSIDKARKQGIEVIVV